MRSLVVLGVALLVGACASVPADPPLSLTDLGPPPANYEEVVKDRIGRMIIDPYSAIYVIAPPVKGWDADRTFWAVCGSFNAKNRRGAYAGRHDFAALFPRDQPVKIEVSFLLPNAWAPACDTWYEAAGSAWREPLVRPR